MKLITLNRFYLRKQTLQMFYKIFKKNLTKKIWKNLWKSWILLHRTFIKILSWILNNLIEELLYQKDLNQKEQLHDHFSLQIVKKLPRKIKDIVQSYLCVVLMMNSIINNLLERLILKEQEEKKWNQLQEFWMLLICEYISFFHLNFFVLLYLNFSNTLWY